MKIRFKRTLLCTTDISFVTKKFKEGKIYRALYNTNLIHVLHLVYKFRNEKNKIVLYMTFSVTKIYL